MPPITGAIIGEIPMIAVTLDRDLAVSLALLTSLIIALAITLPTLAPIPWITLQKIKELRLSVVEQKIDAITNKISPDISTGRLPILSDKNPTSGIEIASPNRYAEIINCTVE